VEGDAVQAEVGPQRTLRRWAVEMAALDVVEGRRAEGQRRLGLVFAAADNVDVRGVVDARGGCYRAVVEQPAVNGQHLAGAGRHQHDVHQGLVNDLADEVAELTQTAVAYLTGVGLRRPAR